MKIKNILLISIIILTLIITACQNPLLEEEITQRDERGCLVSEGYTYCPSTRLCQQVWLEKCPEYEEYYREPHNCERIYEPVKGNINFPCPRGECTITQDFGNECIAKARGATNIQPK